CRISRFAVVATYSQAGPSGLSAIIAEVTSIERPWGALVGRRSRLLAIILLLAALGAVYLLVADPLLDLYTGRQTILEQRRMLALHLAALASEVPTLRARVAEVRAAASNSRADFFAGDSDAIASANLQKRVEELATSVGATIASSETLSAEPRGPY